MAKFIHGNALNTALEGLFEEAKEHITIISPYVKLHPRFASVLQTKINLDKLELTVVFGKNENDPFKSINHADLDLFKQFYHVEIRYEKRLHAKCYASENGIILTSMNLYDFSQNNNIEFGIFVERAMFSGFNTIDEQVSSYFDRVIEQSELLYQKVAQRIDTSLGLGLSSKYTHSTIDIDKLHSFLGKAISGGGQGYCIATGVKIPFSIQMPLSEKEFNKWSKTTDIKFKGSYCHFSGEPGATTFEKPILIKNWKKAKEMHNF
jgi:hypothetical protein